MPRVPICISYIQITWRRFGVILGDTLGGLAPCLGARTSHVSTGGLRYDKAFSREPVFVDLEAKGLDG